MYIYQLLSFIVLSLVLTGCGGGSEESGSQSVQPSSPIEVSIAASIIQSKALTGVESDILVQVDSEVNFHLTSVEQANNGFDCEVTSVHGLMFTTLSNQVGECQFEYTVEPVEQEVYTGQASSLARVSVSETAESNTLPNLSETTDIDSVVTIDLSEELNSELDTSIYIVSEEVTLLGSGAVEVDSLNNTITYTPIDIGVTRIMYSMSDGSSTKLGSIDVAVSGTGNTPPITNDYIREGKLTKDMSVEIDLTDYVSDAEDSVILDTVRAYNAEAKITSTTEHTFTFQSSEPGPHEVAYTVTDGRGGYAVGQVYIEVEPDFSLVQNWEDITIYDSTIGAEITFTAPLSKVFADYTNTDYTKYDVQDGVSGPKYEEIVTMDLEQSQNYCASRNGRLPIRREWELLLASQENLFQSHNWPGGVPFWSADMASEISGIGFNVIGLDTEELSKEDGLGFAACILFDSTNVNSFYTDIDIGDQHGLITEIDFTVIDPDGNEAPYQNIGVVAENSKGVFSNNKDKVFLVSDADGKANEQYQDTSFDSEVVSTNISSFQRDSKVFSPNLTKIDTKDSALWNLAMTVGSAEPKGINSSGIPLIYGLSYANELAAVHKEPIIGSSLVAKYVVNITGEPSNLLSGKVTFVLQQYNNSPNSSDWGYYNSYQEGIPHSPKVVSSEINYYSENINLLVGNYYESSGVEADTVYLPTRFETWYVWFVIVDSKAEVYASTSDDRPEEPLLVNNNIWRDIDPTKPYWFGFGGEPLAGDVNTNVYASSLWLSY
ncbi:hypothetical protein AAFX33_13450 [Vibrio chagasii]|uniref:Ig-like domain-containing protein n=1 Tax=Vibrio chagasii TaxID=170679 RepID=UPI0038CD1BC2